MSTGQTDSGNMLLELKAIKRGFEWQCKFGGKPTLPYRTVVKSYYLVKDCTFFHIPVLEEYLLCWNSIYNTFKVLKNSMQKYGFISLVVEGGERQRQRTRST